MKRIELFVFHHADRAVDDRVYVSAAPPGPERAAEQRAKGYLAFRLEAVLPGVEDGVTTAPVQCSELGAAAALVRDADAKATEQRKILWDLCQRHAPKTPGLSGESQNVNIDGVTLYFTWLRDEWRLTMMIFPDGKGLFS